IVAHSIANSGLPLSCCTRRARMHLPSRFPDSMPIERNNCAIIWSRSEAMMPSDYDRPSQPPLPSESGISLSQSSIFEGHLHPLTIAFGLFKAGRGLIPLIPLALFGHRGFGVMMIVLASAGTIGTVLARYFSLRYRIEKGELIIE